MAGEDDYFKAQGVVVATLRNASFRVKLESGHELIARASGKMRKGRLIRIIPGDRVEVEVSARAVGRRGGAAACRLGHGDDCRARGPLGPRAQRWVG